MYRAKVLSVSSSPLATPGRILRTLAEQEIVRFLYLLEIVDTPEGPPKSGVSMEMYKNRKMTDEELETLSKKRAITEFDKSKRMRLCGTEWCPSRKMRVDVTDWTGRLSQQPVESTVLVKGLRTEFTPHWGKRIRADAVLPDDQVEPEHSKRDRSPRRGPSPPKTDPE